METGEEEEKCICTWRVQKEAITMAIFANLLILSVTVALGENWVHHSSHRHHRHHWRPWHYRHHRHHWRPWSPWGYSNEIYYDDPNNQKEVQPIQVNSNQHQEVQPIQVNSNQHQVDNTKDQQDVETEIFRILIQNMPPAHMAEWIQAEKEAMQSLRNTLSPEVWQEWYDLLKVVPDQNMGSWNKDRLDVEREFFRILIANLPQEHLKKLLRTEKEAIQNRGRYWDEMSPGSPGDLPYQPSRERVVHPNQELPNWQKVVRPPLELPNQQKVVWPHKKIPTQQKVVRPPLELPNQQKVVWPHRKIPTQQKVVWPSKNIPNRHRGDQENCLEEDKEFFRILINNLPSEHLAEWFQAEKEAVESMRERLPEDILDLWTDMLMLVPNQQLAYRNEDRLAVEREFFQILLANMSPETMRRWFQAEKEVIMSMGQMSSGNVRPGSDPGLSHNQGIEDDHPSRHHWIDEEHILPNRWIHEPSDLTQSCPHHWHAHRNKCYTYVHIKTTWQDAEAKCMRLGGNLASVHNDQEYTFLLSLIRRAGGSHERAWIGATDAIQEGIWLWSDGSRFTYQKWSKGQPSNHRGQEHCMEMNYGADHGQNDAPCWHEFPYLCSSYRATSHRPH
ncbi:hypothetical protein UPYG_G00244630 [Umbra pygmaea]|uniref:C-type lectin domain-containing protein n=1 Tax=Umbra pygmaea TaxID=75934 RepID=A0ABD0WLF4_UMBPY